jgi:hypothetical protein
LPSGSTIIEINLQNARQQIVVNDGDNAPQPFWDFR